jgi:hypothetical protein
MIKAAENKKLNVIYKIKEEKDTYLLYFKTETEKRQRN